MSGEVDNVTTEESERRDESGMGVRLIGGGTATWKEWAGDRGSDGTREWGKGEDTE